MKFQFHLYVQKHFNRTYTVTPLPFYDLTAYGNNLEEIREDISEALQARIEEMSPLALHRLEYDNRIYLHKVTIELRPVDPKKRNKRREKVRLGFSLLVTPQEDGQFYVQIPRLGQNGPTFYVFDRNELQEQAQIEISAWLDGSTLEQLQSYQYTRSETLELLEVEATVKKVKDRSKNSSETGSLFGHSEENFWALKEIGINMTAQAAEGRFRKAYRRDEKLEELMQILMSPRNNSVLLVGPSEAGKTAIVHELVRRIQRGDCPEPLQDRQVWMLSPDRIIAGAQYIGTWEERINNIMDECRKKQHILYVEDLPGLLEIGRWSKSDHNVALAIRPHLASGEVVMLGEGLPDRVQMGDNLGPSFMNLFRRVEISAMNEEETAAVLNNVARDLEREMDLRILPEANDAVVQLTRRFLPYRAFPGKAIRLMEETAAEIARERTGGRTAGEPGERFSFLRRRSVTSVNRQSVIATFSRNTGMPEFIVNDSARLTIADVEKYFSERILGQEKAVNTIVNLIATVKAGLNDPNQPLGTLLFIGPTGVGKTQMAKTLAGYLFGNAERLIRFDMSEYRDIDGIAKLIGAFGKEGELTKKVREQPFSVVLLDEFEKADPRIFDIFLQVLGEGRLTDASGKTAYFHNSIIIMTSNLGASAKAFSSYGFSRADGVQQSTEVNEALEEHYRDQVETFFRPEFVNRIDHVVVFGQLAPVALRNIASREISDVLTRDGITRRNLLVEIEDSVIDLVLQTGYSPQFGARPLKREIERLIVSPLARELAQRSVQEANLVRVGVDRDSEKLFLKNVPIDEAGTQTTVALTSGLNYDRVQRVRMDTGQLVEGFAILRRKLADWLESDTFKEMQNEKADLLMETRNPNFWDNNDDARTKMSRFYFLDRLTRRVKQLYDKAEYLEDFAVLVNRERDLKYHPDLAQDYEDLYRETSYLDIEMMTSHLPHRNKAMMLLQPIGMTPVQKAIEPKETWLRRMARVYLRWAERKGYDREIYILAPDKQGPGGQSFQALTAGNFEDLLRRFDEAGSTDEIALFFEGSNVFGFMKGERGVHRMERDGVGDEMVRVQVFAIPDGTNIEDWLGDYREIRVDIDEGRRNAPPQEKHTIIRTYSLEKQAERFIRDMRTNVRTVQVKEVMERGDLDDFILAYIEKEEASVGWEDRFPPTFPF